MLHYIINYMVLDYIPLLSSIWHFLTLYIHIYKCKYPHLDRKCFSLGNSSHRDFHPSTGLTFCTTRLRFRCASHWWDDHVHRASCAITSFCGGWWWMQRWKCCCTVRKEIIPVNTTGFQMLHLWASKSAWQACLGKSGAHKSFGPQWPALDLQRLHDPLTLGYPLLSFCDRMTPETFK